MAETSIEIVVEGLGEVFALKEDIDEKILAILISDIHNTLSAPTSINKSGDE